MSIEIVKKEIRAMVDMCMTCEETGVVLDDLNDNENSFMIWTDGTVYEVSIKRVGTMDLPGY